MALIGRWAAVAVLVAATGCSPLRVHPDDSGTAKVAKGALRVPLFATTLGGSEAWFACLRADPERTEDECTDRVWSFYSKLLGGVGDACTAVADASAPTPAPF